MKCIHPKHKDQAVQKSMRIQDELKRLRKESDSHVKLLLLGTGDAGKSTFLKQLKLIHNDGFSVKEVHQFRVVLQDNLITSIQRILSCENVKVAKGLQESKDAVLDADTALTCVDDIITLWKEDSIKHAFEHRHEFEIEIPSTADYFFTHAKRIADENFLPTPDDIFRAKIKTTGVSEVNFKIDEMDLSIIDVGGQRSERRKWIHCFDDVTTVIFLAALDEYNLRLEEDHDTNRFDESVRLFREMSDSVFLKKTSWILFLNKCDIFKDKIEKYPLSDYFPDCKASSLDQSLEFIKNKYASQFNGPSSKLYVHPTCALDTQNCRRVFNIVKHTILSLALEHSEFM